MIKFTNSMIQTIGATLEIPTELLFVEPPHNYSCFREAAKNYAKCETCKKAKKNGVIKTFVSVSHLG